MYCPLCGRELKLAASLRSLANREKCLRALFECARCEFDFVIRPEAEVIDVIAHQDTAREAPALARELDGLLVEEFERRSAAAGEEDR